MPPIVGTLLFFLLVIALVAIALNITVFGRGMAVPLRQMLKKPATSQYPEQPRPVTPRFHGRHQLNRYDDGLEKCIGCELCAWACPADAIYVQGDDNTLESRFSPGERYASDYQINYSRCILCGLCIEACPTRALTMTHDYEFSADSRRALVYTKDMLLAPAPAGAPDTPHRDRDVRERGLNYYGGQAVSPPTLHGGDHLEATARPSRRAGQVLPMAPAGTTDSADAPGHHESEERR